MTNKLIELHCHIEGAASPALVHEIAMRNNMEDVLNDVFDHAGNWKWTDFQSFLRNYETAVSVFKTEQDFHDLAYDYFTKSAALGCIYTEIFISPDCAELAGIPYPYYVHGLCSGMTQARKETGIEGRMISIGIRHFGVASVVKAAQTTVKHPHPLVTGFGMAGNELEFNVADFKPAFAIAAEAGLGITCHVGEHRGADEIRSALETIPNLSRLGHGVRILEDPGLVQEAIDRKITFEVCPSSNVFMGLCPDIASHPIHELKDQGARITISSDDPPHFHTDIRKEYESLNWDELELYQASYNAVDAAFCRDQDKERLKKILAETDDA